MSVFTSFRSAVVAVGLTLFAAGCVPALTYQLRPVSGEVAQIDARTVTKAASPDSVVVVASYEREDLQYIALDIEVKNLTGHAFPVDPAHFSTLALGANQQVLANPVHPQTSDQRSAASPEREIEHIATDRIQEEKRLKRAKVLNTVLMVAIVVGSSTASSKPQSYEKYIANSLTYNGLFSAIQAKRVIDHTTFASRMQRFDYEEYRWRELAMKPVTLQPGESVRGFVYLPKTPGASFLQLQYPVSGTEGVQILFEQTTRRKG